MHKMKNKYDFVFLSNTPSFYKLNLCEAIARKGYRLLLVLYEYDQAAVNRRISSEEAFSYDIHFITDGDTKYQSKILSFFNLWRLMRRIYAKKIIFSGWFSPEYFLYSFFSDRGNNLVLNECSWWDISLSGIKGFFKKKFISRMSGALPSGEPHSDFFKKIGFTGQIEITGSVGIFAKKSRSFEPTKKKDALKFICVARLIDCKNLKFLVSQFNANGLSLTIVGKGKLESELKAMAKPNIKFTGFVDNDKIGEVYQAHDVFILPSTYEPWGLVVEEALYWGLPVIVSNRVGAGPDMVRDLHTGVIFDLDRPENFSEAIADVTKNYTHYREAVLKIDWDERERRQVQAYINLLK